jgi:hypothetical protein
MARPRKLEADDRYNEESLNFGHEPMHETDVEIEDVVPELGEAGTEERLDFLRDEDLFPDNAE